jgi:NAD(P)-dependent dehydrogenase (short-subunit alcohol dehydrogenase family)
MSANTVRAPAALQSLSGQSVILTGAGAGIGRCIAVALAEQAVNLFLIGRRVQPLEETAALVFAAAGRAEVYAGDVRDAAAVEAAVAAAQDAFGPVDILINNAGYGYYGPITELPEERWDQMMDVNLKGPFLFTRAVLPSMYERGRGQLLHISSVLGTRGAAEKAAYCASKYGLNGFNDALHLECAPKGVRTMTLCPGTTATDFGLDTPTDRGPMLDPEEVGRAAVTMLTAPWNVRPDRWMLYPQG